MWFSCTVAERILRTAMILGWVQVNCVYTAVLNIDMVTDRQVVFISLRVSAIWEHSRSLFALLFILGLAPVITNIVRPFQSLTSARVRNQIIVPSSQL